MNGRNGYALVIEEEKDPLLRRYGHIPSRQVETSVVVRGHFRRA